MSSFRHVEGGHVQEEFTRVVIETVYPQAQVEKDAITFHREDGKSSTLDLLISFPAFPRAVILEVSTLPINRNDHVNKDAQKEMAYTYIQKNPKYGALFFFGETYATSLNLYRSLSLMEALAQGKLDSEKAQNHVDTIAKSSSRFLKFNRHFDWEGLYQATLREFGMRNLLPS